jgi:hypothetical protein
MLVKITQYFTYCPKEFMEKGQYVEVEDYVGRDWISKHLAVKIKQVEKSVLTPKENAVFPKE